MEIKDCKQGTVVQNKHDNRIGHIIGFATSNVGETIVVVQWPVQCTIENYGKPITFTVGTCHPANLIQLSE